MARDARSRRRVFLRKIYRSRIYCYSEARRTSSIHKVPAIWLSNLALTGRTTLTSRRRVSAELVNSACCSDQPEVPTRFSEDTKILLRLYASHTWNLIPLSVVIPCTRIWPENRYRVLA